MAGGRAARPPGTRAPRGPRGPRCRHVRDAGRPVRGGPPGADSRERRIPDRPPRARGGARRWPERSGRARRPTAASSCFPTHPCSIFWPIAEILFETSCTSPDICVREARIEFSRSFHASVRPPSSFSIARTVRSRRASSARTTVAARGCGSRSCTNSGPSRKRRGSGRIPGPSGLPRAPAAAKTDTSPSRCYNPRP